MYYLLFYIVLNYLLVESKTGSGLGVGARDPYQNNTNRKQKLNYSPIHHFHPMAYFFLVE